MAASRADLFLNLLADLDDVYDSGDRGSVSQLVHSRQVATRAEVDGADDELVMVALLHDAFRVIAPSSHGQAIAVALEDRITPERSAVLAHHSEWQHDELHHTMRSRVHRGQPWYADACKLAAYDSASFDPDYDAEPLQHFAARLRALLDD